MDYKELIKQLKHCKSYKTKYELQGTMLKAATAIETLLAEREELFEHIRGDCDECIDRITPAEGPPCFDCCP